MFQQNYKSRFKPKYLTRKQKGVINDFFAGTLTEQQIFDKWHVTGQTYYRWHSDKLFVDEFNKRLIFARRQHEFNFARYTSQIDACLMDLTKSQKDETARKACMDMINYENNLKDPVKSEFEKVPKIHPQLSGRIFKALAMIRKEDEEKRKSEKNPISPIPA